MHTLLQDARYALRSFAKNRSFAITALLMLALGIGATTVVFSVVDHIVLKPLPFEDADRLVVERLAIKETSNIYPTMPANAMHFDAWRRQCTLCEDIAAATPAGLTMRGEDAAQYVDAVRGSVNLFSLLGVRPQLGRLFSSADERPGSDHVVVLTDAFWRSQFGADVSVVGRKITLDNTPYVVIGVLPARFSFPKGHELGNLISFPQHAQAFVPLALAPYQLANSGEFNLAVIARLRRGATLAQLRAQLQGIEQGIMARVPDKETISVRVTPLQQQVNGPSARALLFLLTAVGAVLVLVCINIALLFLAQNTGRLRESAIRIAIGAKRARLVRQALTESLILAVTGGIVGVGLSYWGLAVLLSLAPADLPRVNEVQIDTGVLIVALLVSVTAGIAVGIVPALRFGAVDPADLLKAGGHTSSEGRRALHSRSALIAVQVGLSTVMLIAAGLFLMSFVRVLRVDKGFNPRQVLAVDVTLPLDEYTTPERVRQFYTRVLDRLRTVPGVVVVATTTSLPLSGESQVNTLSLEHDTRPVMERALVNIRTVSIGYFSAIGTPVRLGRTFSEADRGQHVAILSASAARSLGVGNVIGQRIIAGDNGPATEVIGVAADVPTSSLEAQSSPIVYTPSWNMDIRLPPASILMRTSVDPNTIANAARAAIHQADRAVPITKVRTLEDIISASVAERRFELVLLAVFAFSGLVTASIGIYGTMTYAVQRRTNEVAVRMVLGAHASDIHALILRDGLTPVAIGIAAGIVASLVLGRVFATLLFEVRPSDPITIVGVAVLLSAVATAACYLPSRRAAAADPAVSLRVE